MAQKSTNPGIQSSAGLIRYFDAEETSAVKIPPIAVVIFGLVCGIGVILMRVFWDY
jgi:preprotein translocase subunit Sec61beta